MRGDWGGVRWPENKTSGSSRSPCRASTSRPWGRFWVLADAGEEEDDGEEATTEESLQVDLPASSHDVGFGGVDGCMKSRIPKKDLAWHRRTVPDKHEAIRRQRMTALSTRPWHGPLPKICRQPLTIADYILPFLWPTVHNKKKKCPPEEAAPAPAIPILEIT
ncbi:hypothetical protein ZWY2020_052475 [Hordeum vulgare]|nr:hypothetical protein ZWY2020_052475 [Hordeum vulgare]